MINHKYKFIFIHINKTGGASIESVFGYPRRDHYLVKDIIRYVGEDLFRRYFTFAFVRNPWDKVVSTYFYRLQKERDQKMITPRGEILISFKEWITGEKGYTFKDCLARHTLCEWLRDPQGKITVNYIGRFERLQENWKEICQQIGFPYVALPQKNSTQRNKDYRVYYDQETKEIIDQWYIEDIEYFNYKYGE